MKAMILAAGRGERLRPITDTCPKPLVKIGDKSLIEWHLEKLKKAGVTDILINSAYLSSMIVSYLGDGHKFGVNITHSVEGDSGLETAGGIINALPFFESEDFLVVNGDTFIDGDYKQFLTPLKAGVQARLYLVNNPEHNLKGDFSLDEKGMCTRGTGYTFSGTAVYSCQGFEHHEIKKEPLLPYFEKWSQEKILTGALLEGKWFDVGTIQRLDTVNNYVKEKQL